MLSKSSIKIYARVKPTTEAVNYYDIGLKDGRHECLIIHTTSKEKKDTNSATHSFKFQKVFRESAQQADLFDVVGRPVVEAVFSGYNGAILAYGQTGTGKTHSISGGTTSSTRGMIPRAFQQAFDMIATDQANNSPREFAVAMSTLEIYNEQCIDLLSKDTAGPEEFRVELREDAAGNVRLRNLKEYPVRNMQEVEKYLFQSMTNRSERVWKNRISGHLLYEAKHINLSLHYLEQVIIALNDPKRSHVPYRNSSITNFLRDSLGGNSRTAMVFTISLEPNNFYETLSTCRFSQRVSLVKNHTTKVIEYDKDEELDFLRLEVERLKRIIAEMIGEDQMKLRLSASEESVPYKPNAPLWIKSSSDTRIVPQVDQNTKLTSGTEPTEADTTKKPELETPLSPTSIQNVQLARLRPTSKDSNAKSSHCASTSLTDCSSSDESDVVTKLTKKSHSSSVSSTYLDEIYSLLSNDDPQKSEVLNINKLLAIIGLELPFSDRSSGRQFTDEDQKEFKRYLELPQNREVLKVYVRLNVMFQRHVQNEKVLVEKARTRYIAIQEADAKLSIEGEKSSQDDQNWKDFKTKQEIKYQKYFKLIMKSKKKRLHYIKGFTQTRLLLAEIFQDWRQKHPLVATPTPDIDQEMTRLARWVHSLRFPGEKMCTEVDENCEFQTNQDGGGAYENVDGNSRYDSIIRFVCNSVPNELKFSIHYGQWIVHDVQCTSMRYVIDEDNQEKNSEQQALYEDLQRLNSWAWTLRNQPCKIADPSAESIVDDLRIAAGGDVKILSTSYRSDSYTTPNGGGDFSTS